jgi:hypothetical protein
VTTAIKDAIMRGFFVRSDGPRAGRWNRQQEPRTAFDVHLPPQSYAVFAVEKP